MTYTTCSNIDLDIRRRKLLFRSWHRGIREMDLILGQYADSHIANFSDADLDEYERLLEIYDHDLLQWITKESHVPEQYDTLLFHDILAFRHKMNF